MKPTIVTRNGIAYTVSRIEGNFELDGKTYPPGSYLVRRGDDYAVAMTAGDYEQWVRP